MFFGDHLPPDPPPQSPICPSLIPSQKDVAGGWLTVTTSQPRLAVGHSGGDARARVCVCVRMCAYTHYNPTPPAKSNVARVARRKRESDRWWRSDGGDCVSLG